MTDKFKEQARQGDVFFKRVSREDIPATAIYEATRTVAEGEVTGHHHTLTDGEVYTLDGKIWVVVPEGAEVEHQEHSPIAFKEGTYEVTVQQQVDPFTGAAERVWD